MSKITISIDDKKIEVDTGATILDAAKKANISIPTLCHNDKISHTTSCFVCLVKDKKTGRYIPSCSSPAVDGQEIDSSSDEIKDMRKSSLNLLLSEHSGDCEAPCTVACPAQASVEEYVRAGKDGDFLKSLKIIKERIPLPMSIGRVCPRFCEKDCRRNIFEGAVAINDFKRTAADIEYENYLEEMKPLSDKKVAIVGAGPAGLSAAYYLRLEGISSDLYDMKENAGGMLRYGIPEFRLPKDTLNKELNHFQKMGGINFHFGKKLGGDLNLDELKTEYNGVILSVGSWLPSSSRIDGEELTVPGIKFLEKIADNNWQGNNPGITVIIGGGNTAMDCCRSAVRLGSSSITCLYRRTEKEMPAEEIEILEAKEEGVKFNFLTQPISLRKDGEQLILTCRKMELGEPDASGRPRPVPVEGSDYEMVVNTVIGSIGQKTDAPENSLTDKWNNIQTNPGNNNMSETIFAAGDCVTGPATVVEAVASGRRAALGILAQMNNREYSAPYTINVTRGHWNHLKSDDIIVHNPVAKSERVEQRLLEPAERIKSFKEISYSFTAEELKQEGERCLECSCASKESCSLKKHSEEYKAGVDDIPGYKVKQSYDIRHDKIVMDPNKCIKCETCIKISREVINNSIFGLKGRGFSTVVGTSLNEIISGSDAELQLYIENCPTGALSSKVKQ